MVRFLPAWIYYSGGEYGDNELKSDLMARTKNKQYTRLATLMSLKLIEGDIRAWTKPTQAHGEATALICFNVARPYCQSRSPNGLEHPRL
jgi:hypothetical protein